MCQIRFRWSVWKTAEDCWLEDLYVREAARRGGLGRALVEAAVARAQARGCRRIELDVNEDNHGGPGPIRGLRLHVRAQAARAHAVRRPGAGLAALPRVMQIGGSADQFMTSCQRTSPCNPTQP